MLKPIDIHKTLIKQRSKDDKSFDITKWVDSIINEISSDNNVLKRLSLSPINRNINKFSFDILDTNAIFHISHIEKICVNYRLRFLDTKYFKGTYPEEVVDKINTLEKT